MQELREKRVMPQRHSTAPGSRCCVKLPYLAESSQCCQACPHPAQRRGEGRLEAVSLLESEGRMG